MRKTANISRRGFDYKIIGFILLFFVLVFGVWFYFYLQIPQCQRENYDMYYYFKALKTNSASLCNKISMDSAKNTCNAALYKNSQFCAGNSDLSCNALAKNDASLCDSIECKAIITRNPSLCDDVTSTLGDDETEYDKKVCQAYANLNESFFISTEELPKC